MKSLASELSLIHLYSRDYLKISQESRGGMVEWWNGTRLPPMWLGFAPWTHRHTKVEFVVCFSPGSPVFLPPQKITFLISNFIHVHFITSSKLFRYTWVKKLHWHFIFYIVSNGTTNTAPSKSVLRFFLLFRGIPECFGVPVFQCSGGLLFLV